MHVFADSVDLKTLGTIIGSLGIAVAFVVKVILDHRRAREVKPCPWEGRHPEMLSLMELHMGRIMSLLDLKNPNTGQPLILTEPGVSYSVKELHAAVDALRDECREFRVEIRSWKREVEASGVYERKR